MYVQYLQSLTGTNDHQSSWFSSAGTGDFDLDFDLDLDLAGSFTGLLERDLDFDLLLDLGDLDFDLL